MLPALGQQLHDRGYGPYRLRPFGFCPPAFPRAKRAHGTYTIGGEGSLEFTTPLPEVLEALLKTLATTTELHWGPACLEVKRIDVQEPPPFKAGIAEFRTITPVIVRGDQRGTFLLPDDPTWPARVRSNLQRKAATLGLDPTVEVELAWTGRRRLYRIDGSARIGSPAVMEVLAAPETLAAIWSWGLGQGNSAGFGWIA
jgi:CRISPR-associated endoribonuclease Cas6